MNRAKFFTGVNIFLSLVLLIALIIIVWLIWESNQTKDVRKNDEINKNVVDGEKIIDDNKMIVVDDQDISDSVPEDKSKEDDDKSIPEVDKKDQDSEKDTSTKVYHGVLVKADDENEYGGNYMLKNEGDTQYTYFWFDSGYAENGVDNMVGQEVEIEVLIQEDGSFVVIDGPKIV